LNVGQDQPTVIEEDHERTSSS
jgi:hypothetical protein